MHYLDGAQRAVQSKGSSRNQLKARRGWGVGCDCGKRCDREKLRLAAVTSVRGVIANGIAKVFGVLQRSRASGPERKTTMSLAARTSSVGLTCQWNQAASGSMAHGGCHREK